MNTTKPDMSEVDKYYDRLYSFTPNATITNILVAANIIYYIISYWQSKLNFIHPHSNYQLIRWGANYPDLTVNGEYWRLLSYSFIHFGLLHLVINMLCLYFAGQLIERLFGHISFILIYISSAIAGSLVSLFWQGSGFIGGGASGAIFGVLGALAASLFIHRNRIPEELIKPFKKTTLFFVIGNLGAGLILPMIGNILNRPMPNIDNSAHIGGLIGGLLAGYALFLNEKSRVQTKQRITKQLACLTLSALFYSLIIPYVTENSRKHSQYQKVFKNFEQRERVIETQIKRILSQPTNNTMEVLNNLHKVSVLSIFWEQAILASQKENLPSFPLEHNTKGNEQKHCQLKLQTLKSTMVKYYQHKASDRYKLKEKVILIH